MNKQADTARAVKALIKSGNEGTYRAAPNLYLKVSGPDRGSWIFRYQLYGKRRKMGLGDATLVTLAEARQKTHDARRLLVDGEDPAAHREAKRAARIAAAITFSKLAHDYIEAMRPQWTNGKAAQQWTNTLDTYAMPVIGDVAPADITTTHVLEILKPIWTEKHETARRVRSRIENILDYAKARKLMHGDNPAAWRGNLKPLLPTINKKATVKRHPALPWRQAPAFWSALKQRKAASADALQFLILTACRSNEVLGARWCEIDKDAKLWTVPAERMKAREDHRVPLSDAALALLEQMPKSDSGLVFEGQKPDKPHSENAMLTLIKRMDAAQPWRDDKDRRITAHGFRSTFRDWAAEATNTPNIVAEKALAHTIGEDVEAAYRRGDLLDRRRKLMQQWADYIGPEA